MLKSFKRLLSLLPLYLLVVSCNVATTPAPLPSTFPEASSPELATASSKAGNVIAYYTGNSPASLIVSFFPAGATTPTNIIFPSSITPLGGSAPVVAMDDSGDILVGVLGSTGVPADTVTYYYNATTETWAQVAIPASPALTDVEDIALALNPSGQGLLTVIGFSGGSAANATDAYFFAFNKASPSAWTQSQHYGGLHIATIPAAQASVNAQGQAAGGYGIENPANTCATYLFELSPPSVLNQTTYTNYSENLQILALPGAQGAMTLYENSMTQNVNYAILTASAAPAAAIASPTTALQSFQAAVDPSSGNVLLVIQPITAETDLVTEVFSSSTWSPPFTLTTNANVHPGLYSVVATEGVGVVAWATNSAFPPIEIQGAVYAQLGKGVNSPSTPPGTLSATVPPINQYITAVSAALNPSSAPYSAGILSFIETGSNTVYYTLLNLANGGGEGGSPTNLKAKKIKNKFLTQTELIASLTWNPPTTGTAVSYNILQNGVVIANVPASKLSYRVHGLKYNHTYTFGVSAVSSTGAVSTPTAVTIRFSKK